MTKIWAEIGASGWGEEQKTEFRNNNPHLFKNSDTANAPTKKMTAVEQGAANQLNGAEYEKLIDNLATKHPGIGFCYRTHPENAGTPMSLRYVKAGFVDFIAVLNGHDYGPFTGMTPMTGVPIYFDAKTKYKPKQLKSGTKEGFRVSRDDNQWKKLKIVADFGACAAFLVRYKLAGDRWHFLKYGSNVNSWNALDGISADENDLFLPAINEAIACRNQQIQRVKNAN